MRTIAELPPNISSTCPVSQYHGDSYVMSDLVKTQVKRLMLPGSCLVMFSSRQWLDEHAIYIEPKMYQQCDIQWRPNSLFVDPKRWDLLQLVVTKKQPTNLLILSSAIFMRYRSWPAIKNDIDAMQIWVDRLIVTLPLDRFDWNRLLLDKSGIAKIIDGNILDDTLIICR